MSQPAVSQRGLRRGLCEGVFGDAVPGQAAAIRGTANGKVDGEKGRCQ